MVIKDGIGELGRPYNVKQPLENAKRKGNENAIWETIPRTGKPYGVGCFRPEWMETTMTYLVVIHSQGPLRWGLEESRLQEVTVSVEAVVNEVATKTNKTICTAFLYFFYFQSVLN